MSVLDIRLKPSDGETPVLELWEIQNTPSLSLFPSSLCPGVVVAVGAQSLSQTEMFNHLPYLEPFNCVQTNDWY